MKTRATPLNPQNRFQPIVTDRQYDDGWYQDPADDTCPDSLATEVVDEQVRTIISRLRSTGKLPATSSRCWSSIAIRCPLSPRGH